jgi:hypothetical protein
MARMGASLMDSVPILLASYRGLDGAAMADPTGKAGSATQRSNGSRKERARSNGHASAHARKAVAQDFGRDNST